MANFTAIVTEDVPGNRLLSLKTETRDGDDVLTIAVTPAGETPDFRSTGELKADKEVSVTIKDIPVWEVESGSDLTAGANVEVGENGVVVAGEGFGYVAESVKTGGVAKVVRQASGGAVNADQGELKATRDPKVLRALKVTQALPEQTEHKDQRAQMGSEQKNNTTISFHD